MLLRIEKLINRFSDLTGWIAAVLMLMMMVIVFYNAIMRYLFRTGSIALQELEWHFFSISFLLGIAYCLKEDGHVRVDLIYDRLRPRAKAVINIAGTLLLLMPIGVLIMQGSIPFVGEAYRIDEISGDPGGLTHRWLIKALIPASSACLLISAIGFILRNLNVFLGIETPKPYTAEDDIL
jgi:TRAP-type mannitol/chloroaromatic compound transport system permease small subunit